MSAFPQTTMQTLFTYAAAKPLAIAAAALFAALALRWAWRVVARERRRLGALRFALGATLALAFTCLFGDKTNSPPRSAEGGGSERVPAETSMRDGTNAVFEVTNLVFTAISVSSNAVSLDAAWPAGLVAGGATLDLFAKARALTNGWRWVLAHVVAPGETNVALSVPLAGFSEGTNKPCAMFFRLQDRASCASTMADFDGDGLPDVYELHNGTNPYVADSALAPRIHAGGDSTNTIAAALAASGPYSIVSVAPGEYETSAPIYMPPHPVMLVSEGGGYAVVKSVATGPGAFVLDSAQDGHTLFRGLYVVLASRSAGAFQAAFWCGGNLPWSGAAASATFEDVRVRALYPGVRHYGWHFYRYRPDRAVISNCTVNAAGSSDMCGVYSYDGPPVEIRGCTFANFPEDAAVYLQTSSANYGGMAAGTEVLVAETAFDESFEDAWPLARFEAGAGYAVAMRRCIVPSPMLSPHAPDSMEDVCVTNAGVAWCGVAPPGSAAADMGAGSVAAVSPDPAADVDGDGLSDHDEAFVHGTDPWLMDSDGDGLSDGEELAHGTSPTDLGSFFRQVTAAVGGVGVPEGVTNYLGWGASPAGWDACSVAAVCGETATNVFEVAATNTPVYVKAYCDLGRSGAFEPETDILLVREVPSFPATSSFLFEFGDVDGDGVSDSDERADGTDPYDRLSFRMVANVAISVSDASESVTNYVEWGLSGTTNFTGGALALSLDEAVTNGFLTVMCWRDLDGDGVFDEDVDAVYERRISGAHPPSVTDLSLGDADGDGLADVEESAEGTGPNDARSHCFCMLAHVTGVFATTNGLTALATFGTNVVAGPVMVTNGEWTVDFGHCATTNGERAAMLFWDDADGDGECGQTETSTGVVFLPRGHSNSVTNRLPLGGFDVDADGIADFWESLHADAGLSPANPADALLDPDGDGLVNLHEYWLGYDPAVADGSNTALAVMTRSIDDRIAGVAASDETKCLYLNYDAPTLEERLVPNTNCWAYGIDLSCASPWNSADGRYRAGTAITKRHVLFARHYSLGSGAIYFVDVAGRIITNSIIGVDSHIHPKVDISVGILSQDLPDSIHPAKILPHGYYEYIREGARLPVLTLDQDEHAIVHDIQAISSTIIGNLPTGKRLEFYEGIVNLDSGNPRFIVVSNEVVLLHAMHTGGLGAGPFVSSYKDDIEALMDSLSSRFGLDPQLYRLSEIDLEGFDR